MKRNIVDPRLMSQLSSHFSEICTIQRLTETPDEDGQLVETWQDRYSKIPALRTPSTGKEVRRTDRVVVVAHTMIALQGLYTDITESDRAVVDGIAYDIHLVEPILNTMTRLSCEVVR